MKSRFSKILGVGLTLALLTSLLLTATPVSAITTPSVTPDDATISRENVDYSIVFDLGVRLGGTATLSFEEYDTVAEVVTVKATSTGGATFTYSELPTGVVCSDPSSPVTLAAIDNIATFTAGTTTTGGDVVLYLTAGSVSILDTEGGTNTVTISADALPTDSIIIEFGEDTNIEGVADADVTVAATSGIGTSAWGPTTVAIEEADIDGQELTIDIPLTIGVGAMVQVVVSGVVNPDDPGDYTLDVSTSNEDAKTATYEIGVPDIAGLPGVVSLYNSSGILMDQQTTPNAIQLLLADAGKDFTIKVGPGTYVITETIEITDEGLTLVSTAGAATTIIDGDGTGTALGFVVLISASGVTVEGFTVKNSPKDGIGINYATTGVTVQHNIITDGKTGCGILLIYDPTPSVSTLVVDGATVSDNVITKGDTVGHWCGICLMESVTNSVISDNTITGLGEGIVFKGGETTRHTENNIFTGNTITGCTASGINLQVGLGTGAFLTDNLIEGNIISETTGTGIQVDATLKITDLIITGNDITDNEGVGILIDSDVTTPSSAIAIKFNTITGNNADNDGYGIQNDALAPAGTADGAIVDASLNWWGTAVSDDVAAMVNDGEAAVTTYEPFLADTADAVFSASAVGTGANSLVVKDTVGVAVSVTLDDPTAEVVNVISVAKYIANPEEAIADALAFYDVYVARAVAFVPDDEATIKFYAGDAQTDVYIWAAGTQTWAKAEDEDVGFSAYGGYVYVTVDPGDLAGTPFALVAGAAEEIDAPTLSTPLSGADDVRLRPVFAWKAVPDADGYYFQLADNALFVIPLVKMEGDTGRLLGTAYAYVGEELPYSTPYHWRVKAVSGTIAAGDLARSDWTEGVFVTMDEPEEPTPPVVVEPAPPAPPAPIIEPIVEVIVPAATEVTPGWIYAIIAVGGVLVIALLVLIVRTRRVA